MKTKTRRSSRPSIQYDSTGVEEVPAHQAGEVAEASMEEAGLLTPVEKQYSPAFTVPYQGISPRTAGRKPGTFRTAPNEEANPESRVYRTGHPEENLMDENPET